MKWEYCQMDCPVRADINKVTEELDALGDKGWELASAVSMSSFRGTVDSVLYTFKRPVPAPSSGETN